MGNDQADTQGAAHVGLLLRPAHPENLVATCGGCHKEEATELPHTLHYTLKNSVNLVRGIYGAQEDLASFTEIPVHGEPENISELADDLLRRRCLRCHLYGPGDAYTATSHATGCAACHLDYMNGRLTDHRFKASPADGQCLSCHYGNRVGFDYYGRFEHDFNVEYRTPYTADATTPRPFGVEYHELAPDIHQQRGLVCIDCHGKDELMKAEQHAQDISCADCHDAALLAEHLPPGVRQVDGGYVFISKSSGDQHPLPLLQHPAHFTTKNIDCQACHAQWSFNDTETHLLRSDLDEYEHWSRLTVQGSGEIEQLLEHNLDYDNEELPPVMTDKITGDIRSGVWYKGYTMRRWEWPLLGRTQDGTLTVVRPLLNLTLSWIDEDEDVKFDGYTTPAQNNGLLPYTPHTTGPAGLFYEQRLRDFLTTEKKQNR